MMYSVVFLFIIGCSFGIQIITDNNELYYSSVLFIRCNINESGKVGYVEWLNSNDSINYHNVINVFATICLVGLNTVNGDVKCNITARDYTAEIPKGSVVTSGQWWKCSTSVDGTKYRSSAAKAFEIVPVQSMSSNSGPSISLNEGDKINVVCQSEPASRPRTEIKWYLTEQGEIMSGLNNPVYTPDHEDPSLITTTRQMIYTGNRTDNGNSLYCKGNQLSSVVTSTNIKLDIKYQPSTSLVLSVFPSGMVNSGTSINMTCSITGGNPLATLNAVCNGMTASYFYTATTSIANLVFTVNASDNGQQCECTATQSVNAFFKKVTTTIEVQYAPFHQPVISQSYPQTDYVPVNTNVTLECSVSGGNPLAVLSWNCDRSVEVTNNTSSSKASYSVSFQVNKQDNGRKCTCSATHPIKSYNSSIQYEVIVYYAPENENVITQYPDKPVDAGNNVTLTCNMTGGNPLATLIWSCGNVTRNNTSGNTSSFSVNFQVDKTYNERKCFCSAIHPLLSSEPSKHIQLTVYYEPSTPLLMIKPDLPLFEGNKTELTCWVNDTGNPHANITLMWNQTNAQSFSPNKWEIGPMEITNDGAEVSCLAANEYSNRKNIYLQVNKSLNVEYNPLIILKDQRITYVEGKNVIIKCTVHGNPIPRAQWFREGNDTALTGGGPELNMTIFNVTRQQKGRYHCKANSTSKRYGYLRSSKHIDLIVYYPPDVNIFNNERERQVTLVCNAKGIPSNYTYTGWKQTYNGIEIRNSKQLISLTQDENSKLILSQISYQDSGYYTCFVNNGVPDRHGELQQFGIDQLDIKGSPEIVDKLPADATFSTRRGGNITVNLRFFTFPNITNTFWYRNSSNKPIDTKVNDGISGSLERTKIETTFHDVKVNISKYAYHSLLNITTLDEEKEGAYTLVMKNGFKDKNVTIFVVISSKPDDPTNFNVTKTTSTEMTFSWNRGYGGGHNQNFVILVFDSTGFRYMQKVPDNFTTTTQSCTISELNPSTEYVLHLYSMNKIGNSTVVKINATTDDAASVSGPTTSEFPVGVVVGVLTGVIVAAIVIIGITYIKQRRTILKKDQESTGRKKLTTINKDDEEDVGLKDNILYESAGQGFIPKQEHSGDEYAVVLKNKEKLKMNGANNIQETALYAEVVKQSKTTQKGDICKKDVNNERLKKKGKGKKYDSREDVYENMSANVESEAGFYPEKGNCNKDGLVYADLVFNPSPNGPKFVHGIDNRNIYADVDTTQKIDPLPSSDDEETTETKATES